MKKEKTVRTYQRRTKSGKMVTVREHKASYDAAEEARKAAAKKAGAGSELSKRKGIKEESPLGFSADDYKEWYHWDMEDDANNEAALRVEKALTKKMGKRAYNKYLEDMSNSYSARGHKKAHQALLDEHTASQKKQDAKSKVAAKDIVSEAKSSSKSSTTPKKKVKDSDLVEHYDQFNNKHTGKAVGDSFTFSEGRGKDKFTYDARFVTDGSGRYGYVVRDKEEGPDAKYYVGISDGYERHSQLPAGLRKAAEAQGLKFKNGEFVKSKKNNSSKEERTNYFGTKTDLENAAKKLDGSLKSKGFYAKVAGSGIEIYKQGDRPSLKNLQAAIHSKDHVSWGPNENNVGLRNSVESAIKKAFGSSKEKGPGEFVVPSNTLAQYKGDPSELSVARRRGEQGYIIKSPSGMPLAKYDSASAARKALKTYQESGKDSSAKPKAKDDAIMGKKPKKLNAKAKKPLTSLQNHAINTLLNQPGWTMSKAEKYVRTLSDKEVRRLAHKDM